MLNLAVAYLPALLRDQRDAEDGFLGKLVLWARQKIRYHRALDELYRLDDRDLDDIDIARIDFPSWPGAMPPARHRSSIPIAEPGLGVMLRRGMPVGHTSHAATQHSWCL